MYDYIIILVFLQDSSLSCVLLKLRYNCTHIVLQTSQNTYCLSLLQTGLYYYYCYFYYYYHLIIFTHLILIVKQIQLTKTSHFPTFSCVAEVFFAKFLLSFCYISISFCK